MVRAAASGSRRKASWASCYFRNPTSDELANRTEASRHFSFTVPRPSLRRYCSRSHSSRIALASGLTALSNSSHAVSPAYAPTIGSSNSTSNSSRRRFETALHMPNGSKDPTYNFFRPSSAKSLTAIVNPTWSSTEPAMWTPSRISTSLLIHITSAHLRVRAQ